MYSGNYYNFLTSKKGPKTYSTNIWVHISQSQQWWQFPNQKRQFPTYLKKKKKIGPGRPWAGRPRMDRQVVTSLGAVNVSRLASRLRRSARRESNFSSYRREGHFFVTHRHSVMCERPFSKNVIWLTWDPECPFSKNVTWLTWGPKWPFSWNVTWPEVSE